MVVLPISWLSVSITPTNINSKILIKTTIHVGMQSGGVWWGIRLYKNGSHLVNASGEGTNNNSTDQALRRCFINSNWGNVVTYTNTRDMMSNCSNQYLDSPNTTSTITYKLWIHPRVGLINESKVAYINRPEYLPDAFRPEAASFISADEIYYP